MRAASSAWSRLLKPPYEEHDIADDAARDFLVSRGMDAPGAAEEAVRTVTGGRFALLLDAASAAAAAKPVSAMREELHIATNVVLKGLGLAPGHALFRALVSRGRVMSDAALDLELGQRLRLEDFGQRVHALTGATVAAEDGHGARGHDATSGPGGKCAQNTGTNTGSASA
jgi:hypothetical protein